jgi:hypothetical protein
LAALAVVALMFGPSAVTATRTDEAVRHVVLVFLGRASAIGVVPEHERSTRLPSGKTRTCMELTPPGAVRAGLGGAGVARGWLCVVLASNERVAAVWAARTPDGKAVSVLARDDDPATEPNL